MSIFNYNRIHKKLMISLIFGTLMVYTAVARSETSSTPHIPLALADSQWRLVEFQSMDDTQGIMRPNEEVSYTMQLHANGSMLMQLNCSSINGTWSATSDPEGTSGQFHFNSLVPTRILCQPPSLDEQITAQAQYIRSYLIKDGRFYLSLMADGGIYVWEPIHRDSTIEFLAWFFVAKPFNILIVALLFFAGYCSMRFTALGMKRARRPMLIAALAWGLYAAWEFLVQSMTPEANIRVDLLVIWPLLTIISVWALYRALRETIRIYI